MREVVVIGGGLSGLAACRELQRLGADYTIIEVKRRFGGGIRTVQKRGFVMDGCAFVFRALDDSQLDDLGLAGQQIARGDGAAVMLGGSEAIIEALAGNLRGGRLTRMALSSIGRLGGRFMLCLENGLMLDAGAVILAVPAPYAARILRNLNPQLALLLSETEYKTLARVSIGCRKDKARLDKASLPADCAFLLWTEAPGRVPAGDCQLMQVGLRADAGQGSQRLVKRAAQILGIETPLAAHAFQWAEADAIRRADHVERVAEIRAGLPDGISLIGSDYCLHPPSEMGVARLDERLETGRAAAQAALDFTRG